MVVLPNALSAQPKDIIDASQPSCPRCTLTFTKIATLGDADDPVFPGVGMRGTGLIVDSKGQFINTNMTSDQVLAYSPTGKFLRAIGKKGNGPGEFGLAQFLFSGPNDTLYVLDVGRISVFSPTFNYVRTVPITLDGGAEAALLPDNSILLNHGTRYRAGPLQLTLSDARQKPFPKDTAAYGPCTYVYCTLVMGRSSAAGRLWTTWNSQYRLLEWSTNGTVERAIPVVGSSWHRITDSPERTTRETPPAPRVIALGEDNKRQLWVLGETIPADWAPYIASVNGSGGRASNNIRVGTAFAGPEVLKRLVTVIDVIDVSTNRLVLSQKFPNRKLFLISPGMIAEVREDKDDIPVWDIFKIEIKKP